MIDGVQQVINNDNVEIDGQNFKNALDTIYNSTYVTIKNNEMRNGTYNPQM